MMYCIYQLLELFTEKYMWIYVVSRILIESKKWQFAWLSDILENDFSSFDDSCGFHLILFSSLNYTVIDTTVHARRLRVANGKWMIAE